MRISLQIKNLLDQSEALAYGEAKIDILKEAIKLADTSQNEALGFKARVYLMEAAVFSGYPELAMIHFPWIEACYYRSPRKYELGMFNWMYAWIAHMMAYSYNIPREEIEEVMIRMEKTYRKEGKSERVILETFRTVATIMGDYALATSFHTQFERTTYPKDWSMILGRVNHRATECHNESYFWGRIGQTQKALDVLMPVLNGSIEYEPGLPNAIASSLLFFLKLGIPAQAAPHYQKGLKLIRRQRTHKNLYPDFLIYTALKGNFTLGVEMMEEMVPLLENSAIGHEQLEHSLSCRQLFECMLAEGIPDVRLRLPVGHPLYQSSHTYSCEELERFWTSKAITLGQLFDERNGNSAISDYMRELMGFGQYAFRLP